MAGSYRRCFVRRQKTRGIDEVTRHPGWTLVEEQHETKIYRWHCSYQLRAVFRWNRLVSHQRSDSSFQDRLHNTYRFALVGKSQSSRTRRDSIYVESLYQKAAPHGPFVAALVSSIGVSYPLFHDFFPHILDLSLDNSQRDIFSLWFSGSPIPARSVEKINRLFWSDILFDVVARRFGFVQIIF